MNANNLRLGETIYHVNVYAGREPLKVVGIRLTEVELEDAAANENNKISVHGWQPLAGIRHGKQRTPEEEAKFKEQNERSKEVVKQGGVPNLPQHYKY